MSEKSATDSAGRVREALALIADGDRRAAFRKLVEAKTDLINDTRSLELIAAAMYQIGEKGSALEVWQRVKALQPDNLNATLGIAEIQSFTDFWDSCRIEAEQHLDIALADDSFPTSELVRACIIYRRLGRIKKAIKICERGSESGPLVELSIQMLMIHLSMRERDKKGRTFRDVTGVKLSRSQLSRCLQRVLNMKEPPAAQLRSLSELAAKLGEKHFATALAQKQLTKDDLCSVLFVCKILVGDSKSSQVLPLLTPWLEDIKTKWNAEAAMPVCSLVAAAGHYDVETSILRSLSIREPENAEVSAALKAKLLWARLVDAQNRTVASRRYNWRFNLFKRLR